MDDTENRCLNCGNDSPCNCTEPMPAGEVYARHRERQAAAAGQRYEPHCDCNNGHVQMMSDPSGRWLLADDSASSIVQQMPDPPRIAEAATEALKLHVEYESIPPDRGGKNGPKGRAWAAFISARDAALSALEWRADG